MSASTTTKRLDVSTVSQALMNGERGIWTPKRDEGVSAIDFPEMGHSDCFQVEDESFWFAHRSECIEQALRRFPFSGAFLDIGGGNGFVSHRLEANGITKGPVVVLEPGREGAENARHRGVTNVICATLEQAAFSPSSFGAAGLFDVIEHVEDDGALLRGTRRILRDGGVLCVTVPAYEILWSAEDDMAGHHRRYTLRRLRRDLEAAGFDVRYMTYIFAPLTLPLILVRSLRYRLGLRSASRTTEVDSAKQHTPSGLSAQLMKRLLEPETKRVARGRTIPVGTTCLAIALAS